MPNERDELAAAAKRTISSGKKLVESFNARRGASESRAARAGGIVTLAGAGVTMEWTLLRQIGGQQHSPINDASEAAAFRWT